MVITVLLPNYRTKAKKVERTGLDWIVDTPLTAMITKDTEKRGYYDWRDNIKINFYLTKYHFVMYFFRWLLLEGIIEIEEKARPFPVQN